MRSLRLSGPLIVAGYVAIVAGTVAWIVGFQDYPFEGVPRIRDRHDPGLRPGRMWFLAVGTSVPTTVPRPGSYGS